MIDLMASLKQNPFVLAPMAGITDRTFRSVMRDLGCGVVVTELVSAHGLEHQSRRTAQLMGYEEKQRPIGIQLFGETPEVLAYGAKVVEATGADFVDLNFGCPVPKVVKKGAGSAILRDLPQVERVFRSVRAATSLPVTVKIRTGWDESSRNAGKVAEIAYNEGLTWVAIHGRTRAAGYSGHADWNFIADVKSRAKIPILGNGDIHSGEQAARRLRESGCDGVLIGRGCLKNPWIFQDAMVAWRSTGGADHALSGDLRLTVTALQDRNFVALFHLLLAAFQESADERITMLQIKKFASWYSSGYSGASNFRKTIFQKQSLPEVMDQTIAYFSELSTVSQSDTSSEAFLMGGHG